MPHVMYGNWVQLQDGDSPWMKGKVKGYSLGIEIYFRRIQEMVLGDYGFEETDVYLDLSYLYIELMNISRCSIVIIANNRELKKRIYKTREDNSILKKKESVNSIVCNL